MITQHYHWETHEDNEIEGSYASEKWVIISADGDVAIFNGDDAMWQNTPPIDEGVWEVYPIGSIVGSSYFFTLKCDTCEPTPMPTSPRTLFPIHLSQAQVLL